MTRLNAALEKRNLSRIRFGSKYTHLRDYIEKFMREKLSEDQQIQEWMADMDTALNNIEEKNKKFDYQILAPLKTIFMKIQDIAAKDKYIDYKFPYLVRDGRLIASFYLILLLLPNKEKINHKLKIEIMEENSRQQDSLVWNFFMPRRSGFQYDFSVIPKTNKKRSIRRQEWDQSKLNEGTVQMTEL